MLTVAEPFLERLMHPTVLVSGYYKALEDALEILNKISVKLDMNNRAEVSPFLIFSPNISRACLTQCSLSLAYSCCP